MSANESFKFSRRALVASLAVFPVTSIAGTGCDYSLVALGQKFDKLAALLDTCIEQGLDIPPEIEEFDRIQDAIESMPAITLEGLQIKAQVACWSLLGDMNTPCSAAGHERMAYSILRDLIRMHRPELEKPGALTNLVKEIENSSG